MLTTCPPPDLLFRAPVGLCSLANHVARIRYQRAVAFIDGQQLFGYPKTHSISIIPTAILPDSRDRLYSKGTDLPSSPILYFELSGPRTGSGTPIGRVALWPRAARAFTKFCVPGDTSAKPSRFPIALLAVLCL